MGIIDFENVDLLGGFWKDRYQLNADVSIPSILNRFKDSRIKALLFQFKKEDINFHHVGYDSDIAKIIEAISYVLLKNPNQYKDLEKLCDQIIDSIASHQDENGYFNSYFLLGKQDEIFTKRQAHELYCLGHLIEAGIAYKKATGKGLLLEVCFKYLDYVNQRFIIKKDTVFETPGHEEIELALMKLYEFSKDEKYLSMAEFFLENRGKNPRDDYSFYGSNRYVQDNEKIRDLRSVEGHAVRAMYLLDGMAKYNLVKNDPKILNALQCLYEDLKTKQYITGGIGSCRAGEILTIPYDVPNISAYNESCAAIAEMMFLLDLYAQDNKKEYQDNIERILYNGFLSSTSIDGKAFFYENPLEIRVKDIGKQTSIPQDWKLLLPITQRLELFDCSCCPPNIARFVASIAKYIYFEKDNEFYINQFISSKTEINGTTVKMVSHYPKDFDISIDISSSTKDTLLVRIPYYADKVLVNNKEETVDNSGYLNLQIDKDLKRFEIKFVTSIRLMEAHPSNPFDQNRVALMYGPILYCLEEVDNGHDLNALFINKEAILVSKKFDDQYGMNVFEMEGKRKLPNKDPYSVSYGYNFQTLHFIPYCRFANRGESDMIVWVNKI